MIMRIAPAVGASACILLASCTSQPVATSAAAAAQQSRQCFEARDVNGFSAISDTVLDVKVNSDRYFRLTTDGSCPNSNFRPRIALQTLTGGSWICQGLDAQIVVRDPAGAERCQVRNIQPITKADWLADAKARKK
jgi:hypothetical protein